MLVADSRGENKQRRPACWLEYTLSKRWSTNTDAAGALLQKPADGFGSRRNRSSAREGSDFAIPDGTR